MFGSRRRKSWGAGGSGWFAILGVALLLTSSNGGRSTFAETKKALAQGVAQLVDTALREELAGNPGVRKQLLREALRRDSDAKVARWQSGYVSQGESWVHAANLSVSRDREQLWEQYEAKRAKTEDSVEAQIALANWCRRHRLFAQERAHLFAALRWLPEDPGLRDRLGFVRTGSRWTTRQDLEARRADSHQEVRDCEQWRAKLGKIARQLRHPNRVRQETGMRALLSLREPSAIPAIESFLGTGEATLAIAAIDALTEFPQRRAALSLVRIAVAHPDETVRDRSARALQSRSFGDFVPSLLAMLSTPIESNVVTAWERGRLTYRHEFRREERDQHEVVVRDLSLRNPAIGPAGRGSSNAAVDLGATVVTPNGPPTPLQGDMEWVLSREVEQLATNQEFTKEQQNSQIRSINKRVTTVLAQATGETLGSSPTAWWKWWDEHNDVYALSPKRNAVDYAMSSVNYRAPLAQASPSIAPAECFVAGTPVWTADGHRSIETIQVGDLVVSQHPVSGELTLQPVIGTSQRPTELLVELHVGDDTLIASGGHPLWVTGRGWMLAKRLEEGLLLHGMEQSHRIDFVGPGPNLPTYNLIVDHFHTYFVGRSALLCHDNSEVVPPGTLLPGLVQDN